MDHTDSTSAETETHRVQSEDERAALQRIADLLARILDAAIGVPGTSLRIGLDPLVGLIPGLGDTIASLIGSSILLLAARLGIPRIVLVRMSLNMFLNGAIGAIPVLGDLFSVWFRSNMRNAELLRRHARSKPGTTTTGDWVFVLGLAAISLTAMLAVILLVLWLTARLWGLVTSSSAG